MLILADFGLVIICLGGGVVFYVIVIMWANWGHRREQQSKKVQESDKVKKFIDEKFDKEESELTYGDIHNYLNTLIKEPKEQKATARVLREKLKEQLHKGSKISVECQCGCNGEPLNECPEGSIDYALYTHCPARLLRKEREKFIRSKIRSDQTRRNQLERKKEKSLLRKKEKKEKEFQAKQLWRERGQKNIPAASAAEAKWRNLSTYIGKPCSQNHDGEREARNGECVTCRDLNRIERNAMKRALIPVTLSEEEKEEVLSIYKRAREMTKSSGIQYHVDHIKPLSKGGEHHPNNLQIITAEENLKKGASYNEKD